MAEGREELMEMLPFVSPVSHRPLRPEGAGLVSDDGERFPVVQGIPRFVPSDNYAQSFGWQWKSFAQTQLDSRSGLGISRARLERCLGGPVAELRGRSVLEAGCGAGRFTELLVQAGALVHAFDASVAVEVNRENVGAEANYVIAQGDIFAPPFAPASFDVVLCLGVLQHLPSPERGIESLYRMVKPGGWLVIDHYAWRLSVVSKASFLVFRPWLKSISPERAHRITDRLVRWFFPLHWAARGFYPAQALLSRVSPCLVYFRTYPGLTKEQHYEWCRLDTFDTLTDHYKRLRTVGSIRKTLRSLGAESVLAWRGGNGVEARCKRPDK
jgi:2-polyprenyl-3-methyl-5-hydroxy-6-metoxy-1,4-benzoquinol methylase